AGLTNQHRVVLRPAGQHLHDPLDLLLPADHRVELALAGRLREISAELIEHQARRRRGLTRRAASRGRRLLAGLVSGQQLDDLLADAIEVGAKLDQHLGGHALALTDQAKQDVLGADVVVAELQRLAQGELQDLLCARRERDVTARRLLALPNDLLDLLADTLQRDPEALQRLRRDALTLVDQAEQDVLGADVVVIQHPGFFLRQDNHTPRSVGEPLEHALCSSPVTGARSATPGQFGVPSRERPTPRGTCWVPVLSLYRRSPTTGRQRIP